MANFSGAIVLASAEDFDDECDPCRTAGLQVEVHGFCVDCQEYLCKNCFTVHQRTKASRHHQLLDKGGIDKQGVPVSYSNVCTEKCPEHKDEVIKYFCPDHKKLGCHDCVIIHHKDCKVDYIPNECAGIGDGEEYESTVGLLDTKMKAIRYVEEKANYRNTMLDTYQRRLFQEIDQFERKLLDYIRNKRNEIQDTINEKKSIDKQSVDDVLKSCSDISKEISTLQSSLRESKTRKQNCQTYIEIKRAKAILEGDEIKRADEILDQTNLQYRFEPNRTTRNMLSQQASFGNLSLTATLLTPEKKQFEIIRKDNFDIGSRERKEYCILGCAFLSSNKLVLADHANNTLIVLDRSMKRVIERKLLDSAPADIAALPNEQIAVTVPDQRNVVLMSSNRELSTLNTTQVEGRCKGITYCHDYLYIVCKKPNKVAILDTKCNVCNNISLKSKIFKDPNYIVVDKDSGQIYISDSVSKNGIVCMTNKGEILAVTNDLPEPCGMSMLPGGSLLVCCYENNTVHHVTGDLLQHHQVIDSLQDPRSICYNPQLQEVYVGGDCDGLEALSVQL